MTDNIADPNSITPAGSFGRPHPDVPDQPPQTEQELRQDFIQGYAIWVSVGYKEAEAKLQALLTASNRQARIDELEKLPTPKIDEVNMWARVTAHMARTKAGAWIQGARFMRNRVQSYKGKRIAELTKLKEQG